MPLIQFVCRSNFHLSRVVTVSETFDLNSYFHGDNTWHEGLHISQMSAIFDTIFVKTVFLGWMCVYWGWSINKLSFCIPHILMLSPFCCDKIAFSFLTVTQNDIIRCTHTDECPLGAQCFRDECARCLCPEGYHVVNAYANDKLTKVCQPCKYPIIIQIWMFIQEYYDNIRLHCSTMFYHGGPYLKLSKFLVLSITLGYQLECWRR